MTTLKIRIGMCLILCSSALHAQDPHLARNLAATCANCHGTNGYALPDSKVLAGMPADEIVRKVNDFRSGEAPATVMHQISKGYSEAQITLIADYFAAQQKDGN